LRALKPPRHHRHLSAAVANSSRVAPPLWTTPTCAAISSGSASTWATSATGSFAPNPAGSPSSPCTRGSRPQSRLQPHLTSALAASALRRHHHRLRRRVAKPGHHSVSPIHHRNTISSTQSGRRLSPATSNLAVAAVRSAASGRTSADPPSSPKVAGAPLPPLKVSPSLGLPSSFAGRRRSRLTASSLPPLSSPEERRRSRPSVRASRPLPLVDVPR
uniref:Uncharacterized protein n=1 Tax=Oryza nivara TaxID=4536 RepID=A0A0E0FP52_ORYNI